jgi:endonuclease YncB( thermonuclease family)
VTPSEELDRCLPSAFPMKVQIRLLALAFLLCLSEAIASEWVYLENARLLPNKSNDGDSFHVMHEGREYIFRLYFVDCPETDDSYPERVAEQAAHFGTTSENAIEIGNEAKDATELLLEAPFDVVTRWQEAGGRSKLDRHYAMILIDGTEGPKSADLAAVLVSHGLARVHGVRVKPPFSNLKATELLNIYRTIEEEAKADRKGGWK